MSRKHKVHKLLEKCHVCRKQIPKSAGVTAEGIDYVWTICGKCGKKGLAKGRKDNPVK